ncbi:DNA helicase-2 / ATP-dependent DNA helicase PcrA [Alkalithermobacter thermoalcaliphilus JW-YL-7 = DSM 7308]|uniref:ATP-dependent DNA helicase n=1 Tax=Alkalithermobacter thermoalcaliphilus JW-YL-7 = DSM 7308 TaxID=1121328 RepID=A0A150FNE2_CLOPD|nr:ATP-dependent DNA helicase PcrA [[Clostridium] paradoxum JW-YL-7 = DSM 7308]SHK91744.1 DNA helicase-2 / ATP-dependent DNA helicase PcrA [[Clostridium] paradoxum JW-YL-7 = DSM 7308]
MNIDNLNPMQKQAVVKTEGPVLILAGAGSGKTRVLTNRIAYLIENLNVNPANILAITFTNKAANEMKERVEQMIGPKTKDMWISTFHSCCVRILRKDIDKIGYTRSFVIYDRLDQITLIKDCLKELNINEKILEPKTVINYISDAKDKLIDPKKFSKIHEGDFRMNKVAKVYSLYQDRLVRNNSLDFDDLIMKTIELFEKNEGVLDFYQRKFKYIMVDEYQDTNKAQYEFIKLLSSKHKNLCVVGDDDQSIYGWRGADIRNILEFEKDFDDVYIVKLEQNYRSTKTILDAANKVIYNNSSRKVKKLWTENDKGDKIGLFKASDEKEEGDFIAHTISKYVKEKDKKYSDFAILYRTNAQSRAIEEALIRQNIPYRIYGGIKFYERKEIKDLLAYLRLIQNPLDDVSLKRIINVPKRGIGLKTLEKIEEVAILKRESIYSVLLEVDNISDISTRAKAKLNEFTSLISTFMAMKEMYPVSKLIEKVLDNTGYIKELEQQKDVESQSRIENLKEFISVAIDFENTSDEKDLETFLASVSLVSDLDSLDEDMNFVSLMTLHSAKGLEFPVVFLSGMEEGIFPTSRALVDENELEEERRLCYVGITRGMQKVYLTHASMRTIYGRTNYSQSSRFINEIGQEYIERLNSDEKSIKTNTGVSLLEKYKEKYKIGQTKQLLQNKNKDIALGCKIRHPKFGIGTVVSKVGSVVNIAFENKGIKSINIEYIDLEII